MISFIFIHFKKSGLEIINFSSIEMKIFIKILSVVSLIFMYSCINNDQLKSKISFIKVNEFKQEGDMKRLFLINSFVSNHPKEESIKFAVQDFSTNKIILFDFNDKNLKLIPTKKYELNNNFFSLLFVSQDSIFSFHNDTYSISLKNNHDSTLKLFPISEKYTPVVTPSIHLAGNSNYLLLGNSSRDTGFGKKNERLIYYNNVKPLLLVNINDSASFCKSICKFPDEYINTGNNYDDAFPSACFGRDNNICVSFGADNNLYLYNDSNLLLIKSAKSKYIDRFEPYPDEKQFDMLFLKNYKFEEPKYLNIVFDPWENLFYRIVKHRMVQKTEGHVVEYFWSVIVLDPELNVKGEEKFSYKFSPNFFLPTPFGILMARNNDSISNQIAFTLMKIKIDE